ncbi:MAG: response regulator [Silicimonas sp.]|nr:response regulator [Silicimonas sp.]
MKIKTAMLIDDEEIDQRQYKRVLKKSGLVENIIAFTYADEAFDYLKNNEDIEIDVVFLDINMPRMNGFEFLEKVTHELHHRFTDVVLIMLTTSLDPKDRERAKAYEIVRDFINKPLEISHVEHAVEILEGVRV